MGISQFGSKLLSRYDGAHEKIQSYLENDLKIKIHTNISGDTNKMVAKSLGYEYSIDCTGYSFLGPRRFMTKEMSKCIDPRTGQIQVNAYCQVMQRHPFLDPSEASISKKKTYHNIFAFGDVCITPSNEHKTIVSIHQYKKIIANNIVKSIKGMNSSNEF